MPRKLFEKLETYAVVTMISVLVWLYAEGAIQETYPREPVSVRFVEPPGVPLAIEPEARRVLVTFRGSGPQFQAFRTRTGDGPIEITVQPGGSPEQRVDYDERLEQALFGDLGIAVDEVDPPFEAVTVRRLVTRPVPIDVITDGLDLRGTPEVEPRTVEVTLPEHLVEALERRRAFVRLDLAVDDNPPPPNAPQADTLAIELPPEVQTRWTTLSSREATVSYTIAKVTDTRTLPRVQLVVVTPPGFPYDVVPENNLKVLTNVEFTGPSDVLDRIEADPQSVVAELRFLGGGSYQPGPNIVNVAFRAPAEVDPTDLPQVTVNLVPRNGPANGNSTP